MISLASQLLLFVQPLLVFLLLSASTLFGKIFMWIAHLILVRYRCHLLMYYLLNFYWESVPLLEITIFRVVIDIILCLFSVINRCMQWLIKLFVIICVVVEHFRVKFLLMEHFTAKSFTKFLRRVACELSFFQSAKSKKGTNINWTKPQPFSLQLRFRKDEDKLEHTTFFYSEKSTVAQLRAFVADKLQTNDFVFQCIKDLNSPKRQNIKLRELNISSNAWIRISRTQHLLNGGGRNQNKLSPRGIVRMSGTNTLPLCWFNSSMQLLECINWPNVFHNYTASHEDLFSCSFKFIALLQKPSNEAIPFQTAKMVADLFVEYVNTELRKSHELGRIIHSQFFHRPACTQPLSVGRREGNKTHRNF